MRITRHPVLLDATHSKQQIMPPNEEKIVNNLDVFLVGRRAFSCQNCAATKEQGFRFSAACLLPCFSLEDITT